MGVLYVTFKLSFNYSLTIILFCIRSYSVSLTDLPLPRSKLVSAPGLLEFPVPVPYVQEATFLRCGSTWPRFLEECTEVRVVNLGVAKVPGSDQIW